MLVCDDTRQVFSVRLHSAESLLTSSHIHVLLSCNLTCSISIFFSTITVTNTRSFPFLNVQLSNSTHLFITRVELVDRIVLAHLLGEDIAEGEEGYG